MPSSVIKAFSYEPERQALRITFVSGRTYIYDAVPEAVASGMKLAFAKGEYFNKHIRNRYRARADKGPPPDGAPPALL
jgi:hypothetical protein